MWLTCSCGSELLIEPSICGRFARNESGSCYSNDDGLVFNHDGSLCQDADGAVVGGYPIKASGEILIGRIDLGSEPGDALMDSVVDHQHAVFHRKGQQVSVVEALRRGLVTTGVGCLGDDAAPHSIRPITNADRRDALGGDSGPCSNLQHPEDSAAIAFPPANVWELVDLESVNSTIPPSVKPYGVSGVDCLVTSSLGHCTHPNPHAFSSEIGALVSELTSHEVMQKELGIGISQNSQAGTNLVTGATQFAFLGPSVVTGSVLPSEPVAIPLHNRMEA
ncbi:hypothetical protein Nepgr_006635 [Nepenthes gracilis]|uniref:Uncharacterized protein n=1 Tax=Nepenthes gracilis TaxID=150966 RepID=A0AAD3S5H9_NEPGR|nr:hypothetical protein Nepgr_006635 [Nepenthes gracilis]